MASTSCAPQRHRHSWCDTHDRSTAPGPDPARGGQPPSPEHAHCHPSPAAEWRAHSVSPTSRAVPCLPLPTACSMHAGPHTLSVHPQSARCRPLLTYLLANQAARMLPYLLSSSRPSLSPTSQTRPLRPRFPMTATRDLCGRTAPTTADQTNHQSSINQMNSCDCNCILAASSRMITGTEVGGTTPASVTTIVIYFIGVTS